MASNGRMYWPSLAIVINDQTGAYETVLTAGIAGQAATMLNAINQASVAHIPGAAGIFVMSNVGAGNSAPVTSVRVGGKPDHMETRERSLTEVYSSAAVTSPVAALAGILDRPIGAMLPDWH